MTLDLIHGQNMSKTFFFFCFLNPTVNSGEKEKVHLRNFVLTGSPNQGGINKAVLDQFLSDFAA